ncbi:MAG: serine/threonine protein kinase [Phycisphaerae bacterium]|nr:serine/threonine protein kinase [Phycisphaerae bacterium]
MSEPETSNGESRDARIGRILSELHGRRARGESVLAAEVLAAHPDLADELRRYLGVLGEMQSPDEHIRALVDRGVLAKSDDPAYRANLGPYQTIESIGRGGMGIVVKAYEKSLNRTVAMKILRPELAADKIALERFTREAKAAGTLRHPNIVTVYAVGEEQGVHFLSMEYIEGPTLADVIRQTAEPRVARPQSPRSQSPRPWSGGAHPTNDSSSSPSAEDAGSRIPSRSSLPTDLIRDIFRQLLSGLAAAHEAGLIHRDIKPANLLLDRQTTTAIRTPSVSAVSPSSPAQHRRATRRLRSGLGSPEPKSASPTTAEQSSIADPESSIANLQSSILKIADFGLARMVTAKTRLTLTDSVLGTPEYMSPEQARGDAELDQRTDLYSAGVVLYEMLTGRPPFSGGSPSAVIHRILHEEPADPRSISKDTDPHLASLALRLMAKHPEDRFASAAETLKALGAGERVRSPEKRRRRVRSLALVLVALVLLFGGAWLLSRIERPPDTVAGAARPLITDVKVEDVPLGEQTTTILARHDDDPAWRVFHRFQDEAFNVAGAALVDVDGSGRQLVVAGTNRVLDGNCLFTFDSDGGEPWGMGLSSTRQWPDCAPPTQWFCRTLAVADLDGQAGDEIVVVASDLNEYPTRVSIVDPRTREIRPTFWHMGNIDFVRVIPDFFEGGRPAIIAWGTNNKLDGFGDPPPKSYEPPPGEDKPRTKWNHVAVVMILDPDDMDGLGPPRTPRVDIPSLRPYAYAFLNLAASVATGEGDAEQREPVEPKPEEIGTFGSEFAVSNARRDVEDGTGPWFTLVIGRSGCKGGPTFRLDRYLKLCDVLFPDSARFDGTEAFWHEHWQPIIRNGKYVKE